MTRNMRIDARKTQRTEIQGLNERLNNSDPVVFRDEIIKPFGKQSALISVSTLDETLHDHLTQKLQRKYISHPVLHGLGHDLPLTEHPKIDSPMRIANPSPREPTARVFHAVLRRAQISSPRNNAQPTFPSPCLNVRLVYSDRTESLPA